MGNLHFPSELALLSSYSTVQQTSTSRANSTFPFIIGLVIPARTNHKSDQKEEGPVS